MSGFDWYNDALGQLEGLGRVEAGGFAQLPPGDYQVALLDVLLAPNSKGKPCVKFEFEVASGEFEGKKHTVWRHLVDSSDRGREVSLSILKGWLIDLGLLDPAIPAEDFGQVVTKLFRLSPDGNDARWDGKIDTDAVFQIKIKPGKDYIEKATGIKKPGNPESYFTRAIVQPKHEPLGSDKTESKPVESSKPVNRLKDIPPTMPPAKGSKKAKGSANGNGKTEGAPAPESAAATSGEAQEAIPDGGQHDDMILGFGGDPSKLTPEEKGHAVQALVALDAGKPIPVKPARALGKAFGIEDADKQSVGDLNKALKAFVGWF